MRLVVTVDTEADNQWTPGAPLSTANLGCLPALQALAERYGVRPTYLVTSEVLADRQAVGLWRRWVEEGRAEVGAHLHPWTTPPYAGRPGRRANDPGHAFPSELEPGLLEAKLATLTEQVRAALGRAPTAFRAGRYGFDGRCGQCLQALGYRVDSSVTPGVSWRRTRGGTAESRGPDFSRAPLAPYHPSPADAGRPGDLGLWEVPVTILYTAFPWSCSRRLAGCLARLDGTLLASVLRRSWAGRQPLWLRPRPGGGGRHLLAVWEAARRRGLPVAVLMLHSSELLPGASPYWPTARAVAGLRAALATFFAELAQRGVECYTLSEVAGHLSDHEAGSVHCP